MTLPARPFSARLLALAAPIALAALMALSTSASAAFTSTTSQAAFLAAVSAPATDTFNEQPLDGPVFPYVAQAGPYGYSADAEFDGIFFIGTVADVWLSTNSPGEQVQFYDFTTPVHGIAGQFFATDLDGNVLAGLTITLRAFDGVSSITRTLENSNASSFIGFISDRPLVNLVVSVAAPATANAFTTVNNLTLAVAAVPEPASHALWLGGLAALALFTTRRGRA